MDDLLKTLSDLESKNNLQKSIDDVQEIIDMLETARENVVANPPSGPMAIARLKQPVKTAFQKLDDDMKEISKAQKKYGNQLDRKFASRPFADSENDALSSHPSLTNRAIAMHLLREGQFSVASTFISEANARPPPIIPTPNTPNPYLQEAWEQDFAAGTYKSEALQQQFHDMYTVLHALRAERDLGPAIQWARKHSDVLEARGSNLEFELCRLQYLTISTTSGVDDAIAYAQSEFGAFHSRYQREIQQLMCALVFNQNLATSPYKQLFTNDTAWEEVANSFTKEFCSLLGLSADSPLYIAATAGAIALPSLKKWQSISERHRTEWTSSNELPIEIPLPPHYHYHPIFVCPVSKEQATDANPPMMLTCGHVISRTSLQTISRNQSRFKCPYCPAEGRKEDAREVWLYYDANPRDQAILLQVAAKDEAEELAWVLHRIDAAEWEFLKRAWRNGISIRRVKPAAIRDDMDQLMEQVGSMVVR